MQTRRWTSVYRQMRGVKSHRPYIFTRGGVVERFVYVLPTRGSTFIPLVARFERLCLPDETVDPVALQSSLPIPNDFYTREPASRDSRLERQYRSHIVEITISTHDVDDCRAKVGQRREGK